MTDSEEELPGPEESALDTVSYTSSKQDDSEAKAPHVDMGVESKSFEIAPAQVGLHERNMEPMPHLKNSHKFSVTRYEDHFSLLVRSSTIRFRSSNIAHRVYENNHSQFVLEQTSDKIVVKKMGDSTTSLKFLRATYTLICLFFLGFLVVFAVEILLFTIQDLAIRVGATSTSSGDHPQAVAVILSLPLFVHGLASALVICGYYVADAWGGFYLVKNFVFERFSVVTTAWLTFSVFLGTSKMREMFTSKNASAI